MLLTGIFVLVYSFNHSRSGHQMFLPQLYFANMFLFPVLDVNVEVVLLMHADQFL